MVFLRIAIVDDEQAQRELLREYLRRYAQEYGGEFDVDTYPNADALLSSYSMIYDILIFDIDMPGTNGIEAARRIRRVDQNTVMMFITNIAQYAINGYEVDAVDYIIKPIGYYDFALKFQRAIGKAVQGRETYLILDTVEGTRRVEVSRIAYVEALNHYLLFHIGGEACRIRGSIRDYEQRLRPYNFCQIHKSFLVNMDYIKEIRTGELAVGETTLPVGRVYREQLLQRYFKFVRG